MLCYESISGRNFPSAGQCHSIAYLFGSVLLAGQRVLLSYYQFFTWIHHSFVTFPTIVVAKIYFFRLFAMNQLLLFDTILLFAVVQLFFAFALLIAIFTSTFLLRLTLRKHKLFPRTICFETNVLSSGGTSGMNETMCLVVFIFKILRGQVVETCLLFVLDLLYFPAGLWGVIGEAGARKGVKEVGDWLEEKSFSAFSFFEYVFIGALVVGISGGLKY